MMEGQRGPKPQKSLTSLEKKQSRLEKERKKIEHYTELPEKERKKYEIAEELGLLDRVKEGGWSSLTAKETGRIGGMMNRKR